VERYFSLLLVICSSTLLFFCTLFCKGDKGQNRFFAFLKHVLGLRSSSFPPAIVFLSFPGFYLCGAIAAVIFSPFLSVPDWKEEFH